MEVTLRIASTVDIQTFIALEKSVAHLEEYSAATTEDEAREEFERCTVYFIEVDGEVVGSIEYEMKNYNHAYISGLVIKPDFQGKGIGRWAITQILEELRNVKRIDLVTHPDNASAISLYTSLGFVAESRKENYFGDGEPRIVFVLVRDNE